MFNPMLRLAKLKPFGANDLYALFFVLNVILIVWLTSAVWFHWENALKGLTAHESTYNSKKKKALRVLSEPTDHERKRNNVNVSDWKKNVLRIFGKRWYLAIFIPFVQSPCPEFDCECETDVEKHL